MSDPATWAIIGAVGSAAGTAVQYQAGKKQEKAQKESNRIQQRAAEKENKIRQREADQQTQRARIKTIREARIRKGALSAYAGNTGTQGSSGAIGAGASISSQLTGGLASGADTRDSARELGDLNVSTGAALTQQNNVIAGAQSSANTAAAIGGFASTIFTQAGGFKQIAKSMQRTPFSMPDYAKYEH